MRPRQFTDQDLFETARALFIEHGPGLSMAKIAESIGVSPAALFKRVGSKHELLRRILTSVTRYPKWQQELEAGPADAPVKAQLLIVAERIDAFFCEVMPLLAVAKAAGFDLRELHREEGVQPPVLAQRALIRWFEIINERGDARISNPAALAVTFLGGLQGRHMMRHVFPDYESGGPDFVQHHVETLWSGIAPAQGDHE